MPTLTSSGGGRLQVACNRLVQRNQLEEISRLTLHWDDSQEEPEGIRGRVVR